MVCTNKHNELLTTVNSLSKLQPNWDSYSAEAISKTAIGIAHQVLQFLDSKDYIFDEFEINVFPMRDGGIQYEFDNNQVSDELEINPSGEMNFTRYDKEGNIIKTINLPVYQLSELSSLLEETDHA
jgi:hypothetical protein